MANSNPYLPTYRSGFTGPSERIGGSSPYHIDLKILSQLPLQEKIRAIDSLANQYKNIGRTIEFSNQAVSGRKWDPNAPLENKVALFEAVRGAHRPRPGWDALDFYVPLEGKSRFETGAVEDASIFIPGVPGGKITRGSGGGYGYFSEALDPSGRVVFRVGHGDFSRPEEETEILVAEQLDQAPPETQEEQKTKTADELLQEKLDEILKPQNEIPVAEYTGPTEEYFARRNKAIDEAAMELLASEMQKQEPSFKLPPLQTGSGSSAAALGKSSFKAPKSLI